MEKAPDDYFYSLSETASIQYTNVRKAGPGRFERTGFMLGAGFGRRYDAYFNKPSGTIKDATVITVAAAASIPHLLPFESRYGFTYNLPLVIKVNLLPSSTVYGYSNFTDKYYGTAFIEGSAEATLFSVDIQKAVPVFTAVYLSDMYLNGGYAATGAAGSASRNGFQPALLGDYFKSLADGKGYYLDSVYLKAGLEFVPNLGIFASPNFKMTVYSMVICNINAGKQIKPEERFRVTFGFNANM